MPDERYPAKTVKFRAQDYQSIKVPGPVPGPSRWVHEARNAIIKHLKELVTQIDYILIDYIPAAKEKLLKSTEIAFPVVIRMSDKKIAKSHRPDGILKELDSDVIAVHAMGKIVVGLTEESLDSLKRVILDLFDVIPKRC